MKVSVIIPTLNRSEKLRRALSSVLAQTYSSYEVIVVDDGSSNDEAKTIQHIVDEIPNARLIVNSLNRGAAYSRNIAANNANGEILSFLDSDDWWLPNKLQRHIEVLSDSEISVCYNSAIVTRSGEIGGKTKVGRAHPSNRSMNVSLSAWNFVGGCSLVSIRRHAFEDVDGFDENLSSCEDWHLWIKLARKYEWHFVPEVLGFYDVGPHVRLTTSEKKVRDAHTSIFQFAKETSLTHRDLAYVEAMHQYVNAEIALMFGDGTEARRNIFASLRAFPTFLTMRRTPSLIKSSFFQNSER